MIEATDATIERLPRPSNFRFEWIGATLLHPGQAFKAIAAEIRPIWITPMLVLSLSALLHVIVVGWLRGIAAANGVIQLPHDFQYYSPEQQAQVMQALEATSGPVFLYVFPALIALATVWSGWLLLSGFTHLALTIMGGRSTTGSALNLVAWAALPLLLRDLVRISAMLSSKQIIAHPGLSGFAPAGTTGWFLFLVGLLALIDLYLIWQIILMGIGARAAAQLSAAKAFIAVLITMLLAISLRAGLASAMAYLGTLSISRPFYF